LRSAATAFGLTGLALLGGCSKMEEGDLRNYVGQWFSLGETVGFEAQNGCTAGVFRLLDTRIASAMPMVTSTYQAADRLHSRGVMAYNQPHVAPDQTLVDMANDHRALGMVMRRTGLDARPCMSDVIETAFSYALNNPRAVLGFDLETGALMLMDPTHNLLVVAMGEGG